MRSRRIQVHERLEMHSSAIEVRRQQRLCRQLRRRHEADLQVLQFGMWNGAVRVQRRERLFERVRRLRQEERLQRREWRSRLRSERVRRSEHSLRTEVRRAARGVPLRVSHRIQTDARPSQLRRCRRVQRWEHTLSTVQSALPQHGRQLQVHLSVWIHSSWRSTNMPCWLKFALHFW